MVSRNTLAMIGALLMPWWACSQSPDGQASNVSDASIYDAGVGGSGALADGGSGTGGGQTLEGGPWPDGSPEAGGAGDGGEDTGAGGSGGVCSPQCEGKECGPDLCGSSCPPGCSNNQVCNAGKCEIACSDTWLASFADSIEGVAVEPGGRVYVAGTEGNLGWVGALSPCNGSLEASQNLSMNNATRVVANRIVIAESSLFAVGFVESSEDPRNGMWAKLSKQSLAVTFTNSLFGSTDSDEIWDFIVMPSDNVWMAGTSRLPDTPRFWGIKGNITGAACGFPIATSNAHGRALAATGADVYFLGIVDNQMVIRRFDDATCSVTSPCSCLPVWQSPSISIGAMATEPRAALISGSSLYVAGFGLDSAGIDFYGFVSRIDLASGNVLGTYKWNSTIQGDGFLSMDADGQRLYVAGLRGWDGGTTFDSAESVVMALPFTLGASTSPQWQSSVGNLDGLSRIAVDPSSGGGVYVTSLGGSSGVVARCTKAGSCP